MGNARRAGALARVAWHQERAGTCGPPGPSGIGVIGEEHLRRLCTSIGGEAQSFKYFLKSGLRRRAALRGRDRDLRLQEVGPGGRTRP